ncbi:hypothetical protein AM1_D0267 (plasmid) [Acaryochloris marina MBIC11017]|uniref:Uncharacterized protein n=1 Tax=Acaryochloris marina (strain MBIC 11017) TaxID=329726 RepID=A8ZP22_ACAM1|nr:hypothetical protein AM1_D0267 [Acaryochloris marina MBIC11017]
MSTSQIQAFSTLASRYKDSVLMEIHQVSVLKVWGKAT